MLNNKDLLILFGIKRFVFYCKLYRINCVIKKYFIYEINYFGCRS